MANKVEVELSGHYKNKRPGDCISVDEDEARAVVNAGLGNYVRKAKLDKSKAGFKQKS